MTADEANDGVSPDAARQLGVVALAMGGGLALMAGLVVWSHLNAAAKVPTPGEVRAVNALTTAAMLAALLLVVASEFAWRGALRRAPGTFGARVRTAYILRLACREGAGLLGMTVAYIAALDGVLRAYPAYWVNLAPFLLFLLFLATHWPSSGALAAEARGARAGGPKVPFPAG